MEPLFANYNEPRDRIRGLADSACPLRAVFLEGGEHYGKSYLLACLKPELVPPAHMVIVDLDKRRSVPTPIEILTQVGESLGWRYFPNLEAEVERELQRKRSINATVSNVTITGSYNKVEANAQENEGDRLLAAIWVTRGFLDDLRALPVELRPLILAFDGYAPSMSLIDGWFDRSLVSGLCEIDHVRLIVCGREVPQTTVKARTAPARAIEVPLTGVTELDDWLPIVAALKRRIPGEAASEQSGFMRGVIRAHRGAPGLIMREIRLFDASEA